MKAGSNRDYKKKVILPHIERCLVIDKMKLEGN